MCREGATADDLQWVGVVWCGVVVWNNAATSPWLVLGGQVTARLRLKYAALLPHALLCTECHTAVSTTHPATALSRLSHRHSHTPVVVIATFSLHLLLFLISSPLQRHT